MELGFVGCKIFDEIKSLSCHNYHAAIDKLHSSENLSRFKHFVVSVALCYV